MKQSQVLNFLYFTRLGKLCLAIVRTRLFSQCAGYVFRAHLSRLLIPYVVKKFKIDISSYKLPSKGYTSLNDFFIRKSAPGYRKFTQDNYDFCSPVDGCLEVFENIQSDRPCTVKGTQTNLTKLFGPDVTDFTGGTLLFFRLRFADYHRFHFFDSGHVVSSAARDGLLYSVDNSVLSTGFWLENKSHLMRLKTENFGDILWLEVGATNVGSIVNYQSVGELFLRGREKGRFELGGSALLLVCKKNIFSCEQKIIEASNNHKEYEVTTGQKIGEKCSIS